MMDQLSKVHFRMERDAPHAFKVIHLENLPAHRILPISIIPKDDDPITKWLKQHLSATEEEVRSGLTEMVLAHSFYGQLKTVLRKPRSPTSQIVIPRTVRPNTSTPMNIPLSRSVTTGQSTGAISNVISSLESTMSTDSSFQVSSSPHVKTLSSVRGSSDEDKVEIATNQMAVTLLDTLCQLESHFRPGLNQRVSFR